MSIEEHPELAELLIAADEPIADPVRYRANLEVQRRAGYGAGYREGHRVGYAAGAKAGLENRVAYLNAKARRYFRCAGAGCDAEQRTYQLPVGWTECGMPPNRKGLLAWCPTCSRAERWKNTTSVALLAGKERP